MKQQPALDKVTAFITRQGVTHPELLVFDHPTAGMQVPAGTVEEDEPIIDAVCREVYEEAGLTCVRLVGNLATRSIDLPASIRVLLQDTPLFSEPSASAEQRELSFKPQRGFPLLLNHEQNGWAHVTYRIEDLNVEPSELLIEEQGWIPSELLTTQLVRHFFHVTPFEETPDSWDHEADLGHRFHLYWVPLSPMPALMTPQDEWLSLVYEQLFAAFPLESLGS